MNIPQETENQTGRGGIEKNPKEKTAFPLVKLDIS